MILVTGGTGFVGREVVEELLRLGQPVRLLVRNPAKAGGLPFAAKVDLVRGDVLQPGTLPAALDGVKAVIHLVGFITETAHITYEQGHTEATRNILAAAKQAGVTRWVQMSAAGTRPHARSRYHQTKWEAEELVRQSGLDWTIFRPSLVYGYDKHDRLLNLFKRVLSPPVDLLTLYSIGLINGGEPLVQPVSVREVARCFALAPQTPAAIGKTFDLVGPEPMPWREMVAQINRALGKEVVCQKFPTLLIFRAAAAFGGLLLIVFMGLLMMPGNSWIGVALFVAILIGAAILGSYSTASPPRTLIFSLPGKALIRLAELLNTFAPRSMRPSEVLKMSVEDNIGDPRPAAEVFGYQPEPFESGVRRIVTTV